MTEQYTSPKEIYKPMNTLTKTILAVCIFSIAMAALESAVVVYLRALYYPGEFTVALKLIDEKVLLIEIGREMATLIMLAAMGYVAGKNFKERLAFFLLAFAVWDIFYYAWLKVFINWPVSLLDWDILFLIPFTWLGPVATPIICSLTMIILAAKLLRTNKPVSAVSWILLIAGSSCILFTFLEDYGRIILSNGFLNDYANILQNEDFVMIASSYIPENFNWFLFAVGELLIVLAIACLYRPLEAFMALKYLGVQLQKKGLH